MVSFFDVKLYICSNSKTMMQKLTSLILISAFSFGTYAQPTKWKTNKYFTIVNYNVENLFDTINTTGKVDEDFTPAGKKQWNTDRYHLKLEHIAKVLSSINPHELPEIIGLTEIENRAVLEDLTKQKTLQAANYQIIIEEGVDPRGIDCALLYRADAYSYISHQAIEVSFPFANNVRTRDILYVKGLVKKDTLHIFVNHWSSRRGGEEETEPKRVQCATVLKQQVDSILALNSDNKIFIMGDFNDNPDNKSISDVLQAGRVSDNKILTNLMYSSFEQGNGSYYYKGNYNMLDNLLLTKSLLNRHKGFRLYEPTGFVHKADFLIYTNKKGVQMPSRTYGGPNYYGGFSDHFATYTYFYEK